MQFRFSAGRTKPRQMQTGVEQKGPVKTPKEPARYSARACSQHPEHIHFYSGELQTALRGRRPISAVLPNPIPSFSVPGREETLSAQFRQQVHLQTGEYRETACKCQPLIEERFGEVRRLPMDLETTIILARSCAQRYSVLTIGEDSATLVATAKDAPHFVKSHYNNLLQRRTAFVLPCASSRAPKFPSH